MWPKVGSIYHVFCRSKPQFTQVKKCSLLLGYFHVIYIRSLLHCMTCGFDVWKLADELPHLHGSTPSLLPPIPQLQNTLIWSHHRLYSSTPAQLQCLITDLSLTIVSMTPPPTIGVSDSSHAFHLFSRSKIFRTRFWVCMCIHFFLIHRIFCSIRMSWA